MKQMKKILALLLTLSMLLGMTACGEKKDSGDPNQITIGDYEAVYTGSEIVKDSDDEDAIAITFRYTNNSDEAQSFQWAFYFHLFQNGVELSYATVWVSEDSYDTLDEALNTEVQPGSTLDVTLTYKLNDLTSPVEVEFSDLLDEENDKLTIDLSTAKKNNSGTSDVDTEDDPEENPTEEIPTEETPAVVGGEADVSWWTGDWYGTWSIMGGTGEYEEYEGSIWDCCAFIEENDDGTCFLSIWDEDYNDYYEDCLAETNLTISNDFSSGEMGVALTTDDEGNFFWTDSLSYADWYIDPTILEYENTLVIYGDCEDENGDSYEYVIKLCKWGCEWDDNCGERPEYYDSYFMPLMQEGKELPAVFNPTEGE